MTDKRVIGQLSLCHAVLFMPDSSNVQYLNVKSEAQYCPLSLAVTGVGVPGLYQGGLVPGKGLSH